MHAIQLPGRWRIIAPLANAGVAGVVYEARDERFSDENSPTVIVRLLESANTPGWRNLLWERLSLMASVALPHVSPVWDAGQTEQAIYLVSPRHEVCVGSLLSQHQGLEHSLATDVFEQLIEALAALHRHGTSHGDVRPKNVFLDDSKSQRPVAWLADTAIGPLTWWSRGEFLSNDARRYYPPEWRGSPQEPTPRADVYALGLTACELFLGRDGVPAQIGEPASGERSGFPQIQAALAAAGVSSATQALLDEMLATDPTLRPADAEELLQRWRRVERPARHGKAWIGAASAVVIAAAAFFAGRYGKPELHQRVNTLATSNQQLQKQVQTSQARRAELEDQLKQQEQTVRDQAATLESRQIEISQLNNQVAELKAMAEVAATTPSPPVAAPSDDVSPETIAQEQWGVLAASLKGDAPDRLDEAIRTALEQQPEDAGRAEYRVYYQAMRKLRGLPRLTAWMHEDPQLESYVEQVLLEPWNRDASKLAEARHAGLETAARLWMTWADPTSNMTWEGIRTQIDGKAGLSDETRGVLKGWYAAMEEQAARGWKLVLQRGEAKEGYGVDRIVRVYVDGKEQGDGYAHAWDSPTAHEYDRNAQGPSLAFNWRPGQTLGLSLEQNGTFYDTNLVTVHYRDPFSGPVAVWTADRAGATRSKLGKLEFEIRAIIAGGKRTPIPGPPDTVLRSLLDTTRQILGDEKD
jgi:hypothetical protein